MGVANIHMHPILENTLMLNLSNGVDETLRTMAQVSCVFERSFNAINWKASGDYSVYLEIKTSDVTGQIRFHFPYNALIGIWQAMTGEKTVPGEPDIIDVVGELSNVCYGIAKGRLNREGYSLGMALPNPGKSVNLPLLESGRPNMIIPFKVFSETCYIQIVIL